VSAGVKFIPKTDLRAKTGKKFSPVFKTQNPALTRVSGEKKYFFVSMSAGRQALS
jgi:hypothetical protein